MCYGTTTCCRVSILDIITVAVLMTAYTAQQILVKAPKLAYDGCYDVYFICAIKQHHIMHIISHKRFCRCKVYGRTIKGLI